MKSLNELDSIRYIICKGEISQKKLIGKNLFWHFTGYDPSFRSFLVLPHLRTPLATQPQQPCVCVRCGFNKVDTRPLELLKISDHGIRQGNNTKVSLY